MTVLSHIEHTSFFQKSSSGNLDASYKQGNMVIAVSAA